MSDKPKIVKADAHAMHGETGATVTYKSFANTKTPEMVLGKNAGGEKISMRDVLEKLASWDMFVDDSSARKSNRALVEWLSEYGDSKRVKSDNTYNWSWWGPVLNFTVVTKDEGGDPYSECIIIARAHQSGDVRGNYGSDHVYFNEQYYNCFYPWHLVISLKTDDGKRISLESEDDEGHSWICNSDETGTLEEGRTYKRDEVLEVFEVAIKGMPSYAKGDFFEAILTA